MAARLTRNYQYPTVAVWLDENEFVGTIEKWYGTNGKDGISEFACYGWSKGASFFVYTIVEGHIHKVGTVARENLTVPQ